MIKNNSKRTDITFTKDIIQRMLKTSKFLEQDKLEHFCKVLIDYIVEESQEKNVVAIELPYVGILHECRHLFKSKSGLHRGKGEWNDYYDSKMANINININNNDTISPHNKNPYIFSYIRDLRKNYQLPGYDYTYKLDRQSEQVLAVVAKEQNEFYNTYNTK